MKKSSTNRLSRYWQHNFWSAACYDVNSILDSHEVIIIDGPMRAAWGDISEKAERSAIYGCRKELGLLKRVQKS